MKKYSFLRGLHPIDGLEFTDIHTSKAEERALEVFLPKEILLPMLQHRGVPAQVAVDIGDYVRIGQVVGKPADAFGTAVHSGISGFVRDIREIRLPDGRLSLAVLIESDGKRSFHPTIKKNDDTHSITPKDLLSLLYYSGIVGMGGDGEPTFIKCQRAIFAQADTLYINGMQSEPLMTCDCYQMREYSDKVIRGAVALASILRIQKIRFCISDKWIREITAMYSAVESSQEIFPDRDMEISLFRSRYPQGYERLLGQAVYGGKYETQENFENLYKAVVFNVSTCCAFADMIEKNQPCVSRIITLAVNETDRKNMLVPIGTPVSEILASVPEKKNGRVVLGGAMTGVSVEDTYVPVLKTTCGIMIAPEPDRKSEECIRCDACTGACPVGLIPYICHRAISSGSEKILQKIPIERCISCGACSYVCPSGIGSARTIAKYAHEKRMKQEEEEKRP